MVVKQACKKPCKTCPYKKDSIKGYFAGLDPQEYAEAIHQDTIIACHSRSTYNQSGIVTTAVVCTGHIVAQILSLKRPNALHIEQLQAHQQIRKQDNFVELKAQNLSLFDFYKHHNIDY
jgi:hypothetical protein